MKSVKRVFTKSLPRYNLRSRKSAVPVARNSTPKVNREVQASLSEEENCTLSFELPFHPSSLPLTAHVTSSSEKKNLFSPTAFRDFPPNFPNRIQPTERIPKRSILVLIRVKAHPLFSKVYQSQRPPLFRFKRATQVHPKISSQSSPVSHITVPEPI